MSAWSWYTRTASTPRSSAATRPSRRSSVISRTASSNCQRFMYWSNARRYSSLPGGNSTLRDRATAASTMSRNRSSTVPSTSPSTVTWPARSRQRPSSFEVVRVGVRCHGNGAIVGHRLVCVRRARVGVRPGLPTRVRVLAGPVDARRRHRARRATNRGNDDERHQRERHLDTGARLVPRRVGPRPLAARVARSSRRLGVGGAVVVVRVARARPAGLGRSSGAHDDPQCGWRCGPARCGLRVGGADHVRPRVRRPQTQVPPPDAHRRVGVVPAVLRTRRRLRPRRADDHRRARRRRVGRQRPEGLEHERGSRRHGDPGRPHRLGCGQARRALVLLDRHAPATGSRRVRSRR